MPEVAEKEAKVALRKEFRDPSSGYRLLGAKKITYKHLANDVYECSKY